jgi:hypothetical protein
MPPAGCTDALGSVRVCRWCWGQRVRRVTAWVGDSGLSLAGDTVDWSGNGNDLTLNGRIGYTPGRLGQALEVDGSGGCASLAWPVVRTDASFTVMAWVKMAGASGFHTAVSQDGDSVSGFFLQYSSDDRRWAFSMTNADSIECKTTRALASTSRSLISCDWQLLPT